VADDCECGDEFVDTLLLSLGYFPVVALEPSMSVLQAQVLVAFEELLFHWKTPKMLMMTLKTRLLT
jgi:hypothetical protein